ncbi:MAG: TIGR04283 family arsenosugar biosynthesis glycosyltransferase [Bacteroidota bacterium]
MDGPSSPWCSIIIPTLNEETALKACLEILMDQVAVGGLEVIIVDGGSQDATLAVAAAYGLQPLAGTRGRAQQLNAGAREAKGEFLWLLHADTIPPINWLQQLQIAAANGQYPACFQLRFDRQDESPWLRLFARASHCSTPAFRFGDQSLFLTKAQFLQVGGYHEELQLMEGHDIVRRLYRRNSHFTVLPVTITTSARRYFRYGVLYTQAVFVLIYSGFYLGIPQKKLAAFYARAFPKEAKTAGR